MDRVSKDEIREGHAISQSSCRPQKEIVLCGVHHTGTKFFTGILAKVYGPPTPLKTPGGVFYADHPWPHKIGLILSRGRLITTLRDKADTLASWQRRGWFEEADFHAEWDAWEEFILPNALTVSFEDRSSLERLSNELGVSLTTDWMPVNAST